MQITTWGQRLLPCQHRTSLEQCLRSLLCEPRISRLAVFSSYQEGCTCNFSLHKSPIWPPCLPNVCEASSVPLSHAGVQASSSCDLRERWALPCGSVHVYTHPFLLIHTENESFSPALERSHSQDTRTPGRSQLLPRGFSGRQSGRHHSHQFIWPCG